VNILHLSETPLSGAPYRLMQVQRAGGWNARLISHRNSYDGRNTVFFPHDILLQSNRSNKEKRLRPDFNRDDIYRLFNDADILHFHNYYTDQFIFRLFPDLKQYLSKKVVVAQYHSPRPSLKNVEKTLKDRNIARHLVVAQYQVRQFPEAIPVFNAIPIYDELHTPVPRNNCPPVIAYSPSNTHLRDWNNKGYPETMAVFDRLGSTCTPLVITNTPHQECLRKKQIADIAIDEVVTGSYHLNTLEALSQGQVAICGLDDQCEGVLRDLTGTEHHPIIKASPKTLQGLITTFIEEPSILQHMQIKSRMFMEQYWSTEFLVDMYKKVYQSI